MCSGPSAAAAAHAPFCCCGPIGTPSHRATPQARVHDRDDRTPVPPPPPMHGRPGGRVARDDDEEQADARNRGPAGRGWLRPPQKVTLQ